MGFVTFGRKDYILAGIVLGAIAVMVIGLAVMIFLAVTR